MSEYLFLGELSLLKQYRGGNPKLITATFEKIYSVVLILFIRKRD